MYRCFHDNGVEESHTDLNVLNTLKTKDLVNRYGRNHTIMIPFNEDQLWSTRQQLKYKYSKQELLDIASMVIYGRTYRQMDNESIIRIRKLRLN